MHLNRGVSTRHSERRRDKGFAMLEQPPTKKWLDRIRERLSSRNTVIGWLAVLLSAFLWVSDHWDSWTSAWGKIKLMAPILNVLTAYAGLPITQILLMVFGFLWVGIAAYLGAKKGDLAVAPVPPPATTPAAPAANPQSSGAAKGPAAKIMEQISQIKSPLQQNEFAKTFTGRQVDWILYMVSVHTHDTNAFTLFFTETEIPSLDLVFLISVAVPLEGHDYLRFAEKGTKFRVTGKISGINLCTSYIYVADATLTPVS